MKKVQKGSHIDWKAAPLNPAFKKETETSPEEKGMVLSKAASQSQGLKARSDAGADPNDVY